MKELDTLHHTAIQVKDIAKAVTWYTKHFKCIVEYQDETWAMLRFANTSLALVMPEQHPYHFAIVSEQPEKYGKLTTHRDGTSSVYIKDIDNNNVELLKFPKRK